MWAGATDASSTSRSPETIRSAFAAAAGAIDIRRPDRAARPTVPEKSSYILMAAADIAMVVITFA
jgi:hypothetical protein